VKDKKISDPLEASIELVTDDLWGFVRMHDGSLDSERMTKRIREMVTVATESLRKELAEAQGELAEARKMITLLRRDLKRALALLMNGKNTESD